ncbi:hypothetical protein GE061_001421 [Apolygus lucorum]|uniref:Secreted protein n=1 Tax=Apolygus lucorum TaxID=248454 RepID=A0A8S9YA47_APOLU|nr:hypothetical protein GE061_001421 [Apolygus lucorum]
MTSRSCMILAALTLVAVAAAVPAPHHAPDPLLKAIENPEVLTRRITFPGSALLSQKSKTDEQPQLSGPANPVSHHECFTCDDMNPY